MEGPGYTVRMLTLHLDCRRLDDPVEVVEDYDSRLQEAKDAVFRATGVHVDSTRITLDYCGLNEAYRVVDELAESRPESFVSLGGFPVSTEGVEDLALHVAREASTCTS